MEEEKYQKELFQFEQPKRSFSRFAEILPKADFEGKVSITISLEKIVFIAIGMMMVFVMVYAMGVESGKARKIAPAVKAEKPTKQLSRASGAQVRPAAIPVKNILNTAPIATAVRPSPPVRQIVQSRVKAITVFQESKPYTILAGSYTKRENAQASVAILIQQGFNASVTYFKPYHRVCVGAYRNKTDADARRDLMRIRQIYKDAMFKLK